MCHRRRHNQQAKTDNFPLPVVTTTTTTSNSVTTTNLLNEHTQAGSIDAPHPTINTTTSIPGDLILTDSSNIVSAATALSGIDPPNKQEQQLQQQLMYPNGTPDTSNPASTTSPQNIKTQLSAEILFVEIYPHLFQF